MFCWVDVAGTDEKECDLRRTVCFVGFMLQ
jgi:hypothetical protein